MEIGLGYLSLDRPSGTLSGGEAQRTKMIRHLGSSLTDVTYVFDEPTIGLHPHDIQRMNDLLLRLRDKGNTVLVVEHKPETIAIADHVVDLGPGAGTAGGEVVFEGTVDGLRASGTLTGRHLDDRAALKPSVRTPVGRAGGARRQHPQPAGRRRRHPARRAGGGDRRGRVGQELADPRLDVRPATAWCRSTRAPIRGSRRSNPATYTGLLDPIRKAFAKANGVKPALFSANSEGACPTCNGAGVIYTDLAMMAGVATICEECEGKRFQASVLEYHLGGRNISEVLAMSVTEAAEFFGAGEARTPAAHAILERLADVGLGYLSLGQPLTTLSGGERQRLKLATHMAEKGGVYVLDEPTTGLHLADVEQLLGLLDRLVDSGKSVIVIEHHQAVMAHADWIIDLGPGAGHDGGRIVFEGTPADLVAGRRPRSPASTSRPTSAADRGRRGPQPASPGTSAGLPLFPRARSHDLGALGQPVGAAKLGFAHAALLARRARDAPAGRAPGHRRRRARPSSKYALLAWRISPVRGFSASTLTPTSIEVRQAALTIALKVTSSPTWIGTRKSTRSMAAVTTRRRECLIAARPAASSASFITVPPCTFPALLASPMPISRASWVVDSEAGFGSTRANPTPWACVRYVPRSVSR